MALGCGRAGCWPLGLFAIAIDWQRNGLCRAQKDSEKSFTEHLVRYEYVGQAQRDDLATAKAA